MGAMKCSGLLRTGSLQEPDGGLLTLEEKIPLQTPPDGACFSHESKRGWSAGASKDPFQDSGLLVSHPGLPAVPFWFSWVLQTASLLHPQHPQLLLLFLHLRKQLSILGSRGRSAEGWMRIPEDCLGGFSSPLPTSCQKKPLACCAARRDGSSLVIRACSMAAMRPRCAPCPTSSQFSGETGQRASSSQLACFLPDLAIRGERPLLRTPGELLSSWLLSKV